MRKKIVAGNWKMNLNKNEAEALFLSLNEANFSDNVDVLICPPSIYLFQFSSQSNGIKIGTQNSSDQNNGAYTGEISAEMLSSINVDYALVGHSERREYYKEDDGFLSGKVDQLLSITLQVLIEFSIQEKI